MADELWLPVVAAAALVWCLVLALRQQRSDRLHTPVFVWRQACDTGWSEWVELVSVSPSTEYSDVLTTVRNEARPNATAVQFASVVRPSGAPDYTLRVLFMSAVRDPAHDRDLVTTGCVR